MAVTSIWAVTDRVDRVVDYVENPEKTIERPELSSDAISARKAVGDVIAYAENADKTEKMMFVTGINCNAQDAANDFVQTKQSWGKTGGRLAYHGYQSFLEGDGDITAEQAHEIGVKLAKEVWGDRFEVVVATHLNTGHYHNHFIINSVSFVDGLKYRRTKTDYSRMRVVSDRLCKEAKLNVIEDPSSKRGMTYDEWIAERTDKKTVRGMIREDIDYAIKMSRTEKQFASAMREMGYEFKFFKKDGSFLEHAGLKPPGAKGYFRFRSLGPDYEYDSIRRRIIENTLVPAIPILIEDKKDSVSYEPPITQLEGLPRSYQRYCIRLYAYITRPSKREYIPMALREDIAKLDRYIEHLDYLYLNQIDSGVSLEARRKELKHRIGSLNIKRRQLYNAKKRALRLNDPSQVEAIKSEIRKVSQEIRKLQKEVSLCESISVSSDKVAKGLAEPDRKPTNESPKITLEPKNKNRS